MPVNTQQENGSINQEWQRLEERRTEFLGEADGLRRKLASFPQNPEAQELLGKRMELENRIEALKQEIKYLDWEISCIPQKLARRRAALTSATVRRELDAKAEQSLQRLATFIRLGAEESFIENEKRIIFERSAPLEEVEKYFATREASWQQERSEAQQNLDTALAELEIVKRRYSEAKHCLEEVLGETDQQARACRAEQVELGARDRRSLEWVIRNAPSHQKDVVRLYRLRFPADALADLFPSQPSRPFVAPTGELKRRHLKPQQVTTSAANVNAPTPAPPAWRFRVVFDEAAESQELPRDRKSFIARLRSALSGKRELSSMSPEKIYEKLTALTLMSVAGRQHLKQIVGEEEKLRSFRGWKIVKAEGRYRLFLQINEEERTICFLPSRRRDSYLEH